MLYSVRASSKKMGLSDKGVILIKIPCDDNVDILGIIGWKNFTKKVSQKKLKDKDP